MQEKILAKSKLCGDFTKQDNNKLINQIKSVICQLQHHSSFIILPNQFGCWSQRTQSILATFRQEQIIFNADKKKKIYIYFWNPLQTLPCLMAQTIKCKLSTSWLHHGSIEPLLSAHYHAEAAPLLADTRRGHQKQAFLQSLPHCERIISLALINWSLDADYVLPVLKLSSD